MMGQVWGPLQLCLYIYPNSSCMALLCSLCRHNDVCSLVSTNKVDFRKKKIARKRYDILIKVNSIRRHSNHIYEFIKHHSCKICETKQTELKGEIHKYTIIVRDFNTAYSTIE